jgi:hypothetical protein
MHATLESAREYAERKRVQGSVHYIDELPSVVFDGATESLVVSEINTERFFSRFNLKRLQAFCKSSPLSSLSLFQTMDLFRSSSAMWSVGYPLRNSSILSLCEKPEGLVELTKGERLSSWASMSAGRNYLLNWVQRPFKRRHADLHTLIAGANALLRPQARGEKQIH